MKCPICKAQIEDDAKRCKHCGSYTPEPRSAWEWIKDKVQFLTYIAAIVVLILMYQSNRRMQEQLQLQRESIEQLSKEFIEEKRPRIEIIPTKIELIDTSLLLYVDFHNTGFADAEDLLLYAVVKYKDAPTDTLAFDLTRIPKITKVRPLTQRYLASISKRANLICLIEVRYTWAIQNLNYKRKRYFSFPYDEKLEEYKIYLLAEDQVEELWE